MSENQKNESPRAVFTNTLRRERSAAYPSHDLEECISAVSKLSNNLGKGPFSRNSAAVALGYKGVSGASALKISACTQFGLLVRSGNTYYISDLARRVLAPTSEDERRIAIAEAAKTPSLYASLITEYKGQALPMMLANILYRNYGIIENSAQRASEVLKTSLEFAGLLNNGVICETPKDLVDFTPFEKKSTEGPRMPESITGMPVASTEMIEVEIPGVEAKILLSKKYTFALSMGDLADGIKSLKDSLERVNNAIGAGDEES